MFKNTFFHIILTFLLLLVQSTASYSQAVPIIRLKQAVDSVMKNYPGLQAKQMYARSGEKAVSDAKHQQLPSLKLHYQADLGTDNSLEGSYFPMGIVPSSSGGRRADNNMDVAYGQLAVGYTEYELCTFGLNRARIETAKASGNEATADEQKTAYWLQYRVTQLYFDILKYNLISIIQQKNIDRYEVLYKYIKAYTSSGIKAGVDSSVANAEVSKAKIQLIETMRTLDELKSDLIFYTGMKNAEFNVDTTLYHLSSSAVNQLQVIVSNDSVSLNNPVLNYYKTRWDNSLAQEKLIRKGFMPKIYFLGAAWTRGSTISSTDVYGNPSSGLNFSRYNYMVGLAFSYNIIDLVHQKDKTAIQFYQTEAHRLELSEQKSLLTNQLHQADIAVKSSIDKIKEIPVQLRASQDAYSQKLAQYNSGLINIVELTNVSYLLFSAETDEVEARSELLNTLLLKAVTNNTLNTFLTSFK